MLRPSSRGELAGIDEELRDKERIVVRWVSVWCLSTGVIRFVEYSVHPRFAAIYPEFWCRRRGHVLQEPGKYRDLWLML